MDRYEVLGYLPGVAPFETMLVRKKGAPRDSAQYVLQRAKLEGLPEAQQRCVINAATVLQQLANGCPHQVLVAESFMDPSGYACSVLEHCEVGPASLLLEAVRKQKEPLSESQVLAWTNDVALAIQHLHGIGLLHLNVGVNAVHICADGQAKLGDFAIACQLPDGASETDPTAISFDSLPPEILRLAPVGRPADIWGLGCLLFQLCALRPAFEVVESDEGVDFEACLAKIGGGSPVLPEKTFNHKTDEGGWSKGLQELLGQMLTANPAARPTVDQVLERLYDLRTAAGPPVPSGLVMETKVQPTQSEAYLEGGIDADARSRRRSTGTGLDRLSQPVRKRDKAKTRLEEQGLANPMR
jgi:serine/threonine protein kinase